MPAKSVEAIIDDSGSMSGTDPTKPRTGCQTPRACSTRTRRSAAVEFGTGADTLFGPCPIRGEPRAIRRRLSLVDADNGGTDYDAGSSLANLENPKANARIFLSDGEPNLGSRPGSANPRIPTYVVGFGQRPTQRSCAQIAPGDRRPAGVQLTEQ